MFNHTAIKALLGEFGDLFNTTELIRGNLSKRFYKADDAIDGILLSALTNLPCLLCGPPGVAKSLLIRTFCGMLGLETDQGAENRQYFEYLLNKFTEPTELFGPFVLETDGEGNQGLRRVDDGMLHTCRVAFLDEVFNGSSAILNTLLALMNEGKFHDRGDIRPSKLELIFGATNDPPEARELRAMYDRFVIRVHMDNVERTPDALATYIQTANVAQRPLDKNNEIFSDLLDRIVEFREEIGGRLAMPGTASALFDFTGKEGRSFLSNLSFIAGKAQADGVGSFSNRRIFQLCQVLLVRRLMRSNRDRQIGTALAFSEYEVIWKYFFDIPGVATESFEDVFDTTVTSGAK